MIEQIIEQLNIPGDLLYLTQYGSHLYGINTENSDLDYRGIFIPKIRDIVLKRDVDEYNTELNINNIKVDVKLFSIHKFIRLCSKADTNALDVLFSYNPERKDIQQYVYNKEQYYENGIYDFVIAPLPHDLDIMKIIAEINYDKSNRINLTCINLSFTTIIIFVLY